MANDENLKTPSPIEARENGKKGGIVSGQSRRKKADMRKAVQTILDGNYIGTSNEKVTGAEAMAKKLFALAMEEHGKQNIAAMKLIMELTGQDKDALTDKKTKAEIKLLEAKINALTNSDTTALDKLDEILENIKNNAEKQNSEDET